MTFLTKISALLVVVCSLFVALPAAAEGNVVISVTFQFAAENATETPASESNACYLVARGYEDQGPFTAKGDVERHMLNFLREEVLSDMKTTKASTRTYGYTSVDFYITVERECFSQHLATALGD